MRNFTNEELYIRRQRMENIKENIKLVLVILIGIIIIYNLSLILQAIKNPNKTPSFLGVKTFTIITGSMMPEINVGDIVVVKEIEENELHEGDIITFRKNNEIITHRIKKIEDTEKTKCFITKGDNNNTEDAEAIEYSSIEGKVEKVIPQLGKIVIMLKDKLTVVLLLIVFLVMYIFDIKSQNKKIMREKKKELLNKRRE